MKKLFFSFVVCFLFTSCQNKVDFYSKVIEDGVCKREEFSWECASYLEKMIPFTPAWDTIPVLKKMVIVKAYYSALFAPLVPSKKMLDGTPAASYHLYVLNLKNPYLKESMNKTVFNHLMNTIESLDYDPEGPDSQFARYNFIPMNKVTIDENLFSTLDSDAWYIHLSILMHETMHARPSFHVPCENFTKFSWCDVDTSGAFGFEALTLTMIHNGMKNEPSDHFFINEEGMKEIEAFYQKRIERIFIK